MRTAEKAWIGLGAGILAYEILCPPEELLSEGMDRLIEKHPIATRAIIGAFALHLANLVPEKIDGIHHLSRFVSRAH